MAILEFKMPKMGESISEATVISWSKSIGDFVSAEEILVEVATDKVDNDVPSPVSGTITEILFSKDDIVKVGEVMALIDTSQVHGARPTVQGLSDRPQLSGNRQPSTDNQQLSGNRQPITDNQKSGKRQPSTDNPIFLSPLIISIAQKENLSLEEVQNIVGSGADGRIQKSDVFNYLKNRRYPLSSRPTYNLQPATGNQFQAPKITIGENDRIIEMDRMRQMIGGHMVYSKHTSPHVTSYLEADVTDLVAWRDKTKDAFATQYKCKLTFTPIFVDAVAKAIQDFPNINASVDGSRIIVRTDINIGMATALPSGNLIVPVVRKANEKSLPELAKEVNNLAESARNNNLKPDEVRGSTFTISNVGTFGSLMGTPIINQPEVAILAFGIIKKRPEVISGPNGDEIAIRSMMFLSLSFDHRIVDGFLGGSFLRKVGDYLEQFDTNTTF